MRRRIARAIILPLWLGAGLVVVGVVAVRAGVGLHDVLLLLPTRSHLLPALAVAIGVGARGARFALLARGLGVKLGLGASLAAQLAGDAAGAVTPMRVGADPAKIAVAGRQSRDPGGIGALLVGEGLAEGVLLLLIAGALFLFWPAAWLPGLGVGVYGLLLLAAAGGFLLLGRGTVGREPPRIWQRLHLGRTPWRRTRIASRRFHRTARHLRRMPARIWLGVLGLSALHIAMRLVILPLLALGAGATAPLGPLFAWPLLLLYASSLVPMPAGGGTVELAFAAALSGALPSQMLSGLTLWWRFYTFYLGALAGGLLLVASSGSRLLARSPVTPALPGPD